MRWIAVDDQAANAQFGNDTFHIAQAWSGLCQQGLACNLLFSEPLSPSRRVQGRQHSIVVNVVFKIIFTIFVRLSVYETDVCFIVAQALCSGVAASSWCC